MIQQRCHGSQSDLRVVVKVAQADVGHILYRLQPQGLWTFGVAGGKVREEHVPARGLRPPAQQSLGAGTQKLLQMLNEGPGVIVPSLHCWRRETEGWPLDVDLLYHQLAQSLNFVVVRQR